MPSHAVLQHFEAPRLQRELIHEDDIQHDPADRKQAISGAVDGCDAGHLDRHMENADRDEQGSNQAQHGGVVSLHVEEREGPQEHDDGESGEIIVESQPVPQGIVALRP
jgi:hypothetical protein